jgi:protein arginine kinase activator
MKCQQCEKPATFHITELTGPKPQEVHLCEDHARTYLTQPDDGGKPESVAGVFAQQLQVGQTAEELARLDRRACSACGITFYEFRHQGRLGCPHDYTCFKDELEPLIVNIHGETIHTGKRPKRSASSVDRKSELIRLRREMKSAVDKEDYERAVQMRDEIRDIEQEGNAS